MDKERYKLIRKGCFNELPDYFNAPCLEIKNKNLTYPTTQLQLTLPGFESIGDLILRLGRFFEILTQGIYGGKIGDFYEFTELENGNNTRTEPDITHQKPNILREVKATSIRDSLKLRDKQMKKYLDLQAGEHFPEPPIIRFEVFRHAVRGLSKICDKSGLEGVIKELTEGIRAMISFPFSLMYRIYQANISFTARYEGKTFHNITRFHARGLNYLLSEPKETFKELNIDPGSFKFQKKKFPEDITINGRKVIPFPVLIINEKNPALELEYLREIYYSDVPF